VSIVGPTGCGKTTLLNIIAGFLRPTTGTVRIEGRPIAGPGPDRGFVFQQANLYPWLTVRDNVAFGLQHGRRLRVPVSRKKDVEDRVHGYLTRVGLEYASDLFPYQISGGMKARAALGRVLISDPQILLMDEPFSALDALTRASMHKLLLELLRGEGKRTIVLITHDVEEAILLSDRVFVMSIAPATVAREFLVDFGPERDYDRLLGSPRLTSLKVEILQTLRPYLCGL
jgi:NitT/TauT family transport system ATP-binding protein